MNLYDTVKALCVKKGISIFKLCQETKISRSTFSELKFGRTLSISITNLQKIAEYFKCTVDELISGDIESKNEEVTAWEQIKQECLNQALALLKTNIVSTSKPVDMIKKYVDIAISIDMFNLHWKAKNCPSAENKGGKLCNKN